jgi:tetraacyldisaccharide 4'-kinase
VDSELEEFVSRCARRDLDALITTEKDSVRFPHRAPEGDVPILFLRVEIEILKGHAVWDDLIGRICHPPPVLPPGLLFA